MTTARFERQPKARPRALVRLASLARTFASFGPCALALCGCGASSPGARSPVASEPAPVEVDLAPSEVFEPARHTRLAELPELRLELVAWDPNGDEVPGAELAAWQRDLLPRLQACVGHDAVREPVAYDLTIGADGTVRSRLTLKERADIRARDSRCTEYDAYMGRCERVEQPGAPPEPSKVSTRTLDCFSEALDTLRSAPPQHGPLRARLTIVPPS